MRTTRQIGGRKFMWDGRAYESKDAAESAAARYADDGFEVNVVEEETREERPCGEDGEPRVEYLVYSRRQAQASAGDAEAAS